MAWPSFLQTTVMIHIRSSDREEHTTRTASEGSSEFVHTDINGHQPRINRIVMQIQTLRRALRHESQATVRDTLPSTYFLPGDESASDGTDNNVPFRETPGTPLIGLWVDAKLMMGGELTPARDIWRIRRPIITCRSAVGEQNWDMISGANGKGSREQCSEYPIICNLVHYT
ncbi:uncharacterized protein FOMMEDRAFT_25427 [Fomitiporia mediterranea MF3/22]|uniref:uncharacterized protein n=1 Tax=Fomitiporia mediterranea (strain MF3/22) TaxID=694068 RepID=UPI0004409BCA|nr:uncharacterized protein FOMMEDRAFT_25427 [Fomitiporia mediterranea MF3/22]EJD08306.1 hypothetical protein FOMMEDRAFT_25427 [Fomitiporia mediterranea MF3/22]